jgi:2-oxoglutarate ferredoxin oxidoreductase subunit alpha
VKEARAEGIKAGLFRPITIWPFPEKEIASLSRKARAIIVPEMNMGQYRLEVERATQGNTRVTGVNKVTGELITPSEILAAIKSL